MILDNKRKVIFLHNPKCGGTFLKEEYQRAGYGDTTLFFTTWSKLYNTDPWHITYSLIPRFVPDWEEYQIYTMIRNPYNRFYSALKEARKELRRDRILRSSYLMRGRYAGMNRINKFLLIIKEYLFSDCGYGNEKFVQDFLNSNDLSKSLELLLSKDYFTQDLILRNPCIPWFMPQSYFAGMNVKQFHFESYSDWEEVADLLELPTLLDNLKLPDDYDINDSARSFLLSLYFEDKWLFDLYK